jgi:predicted TIM-barrel fold metal-dependent hydrolase
MSSTLVTMPIVDTDSHVTEPPDLWTSRLGQELQDIAPHTFFDERRQEERWQIGQRRLTGVGLFAMAGWKEFPPSNPKSLEEADTASWHPGERLNRLDEYGVYAQVLYPNLLAFYSHVFLDQIRDRDMLYACVKAYNDFLTDFASEDPKRLLPMMVLPMWDLEQSLAEIRRCHRRGHKGIVFSNAPEKIGLPRLRDDHWTPLFALAEELRLPINFHVGFMSFQDEDMQALTKADFLDVIKESSLGMMSNARAITEIILSGLCHRFPALDFVSVESGYGWLPYLQELLDWQWLNYGAAQRLPDMEMPSHYLKRQVYGTFWFEQEPIRKMLDFLPDNVMFETDFPHPTSLSPGPASSAEIPRVMAEKTLAGLPDDLVRKVLYQNAARVYGLELPTGAGTR